jgi:hypothetical protein
MRRPNFDLPADAMKRFAFNFLTFVSFAMCCYLALVIATAESSNHMPFRLHLYSPDNPIPAYDFKEVVYDQEWLWNARGLPEAPTLKRAYDCGMCKGFFYFRAMTDVPSQIVRPSATAGGPDEVIEVDWDPYETWDWRTSWGLGVGRIWYQGSTSFVLQIPLWLIFAALLVLPVIWIAKRILPKRRCRQSP